MDTQQMDTQQEKQEERHRGVVKWFNEQKGYGFIAGTDGRDYFCHYSGISAVNNRGFKLLREDEQVTFRLEPADKGPRAIDVVVVS